MQVHLCSYHPGRHRFYPGGHRKHEGKEQAHVERHHQQTPQDIDGQVGPALDHQPGNDDEDEVNPKHRQEGEIRPRDSVEEQPELDIKAEAPLAKYWAEVAGNCDGDEDDKDAEYGAQDPNPEELGKADEAQDESGGSHQQEVRVREDWEEVFKQVNERIQPGVYYDRDGDEGDDEDTIYQGEQSHSRGVHTVTTPY